MTVQQYSSARLACVIAGLLGSVVCAGCGETEAVNVSTRYGAGVKFSGLGSTFGWAPSAPADPANPLVAGAELRQLIHNVIERELKARGFTPGGEGPADFLVDYRIGKRQKTDSGINPHGEVVDEGSLVLDVLNPQNGSLIWRGVAQARILYGITPDVREKRINLAIKRLMKDFPPK